MRKGEWVNAHEWLKEYNDMEARELEKRRFFMWLMREHNAGNDTSWQGPLQSNYRYVYEPLTIQEGEGT